MRRTSSLPLPPRLVRFRKQLVGDVCRWSRHCDGHLAGPAQALPAALTVDPRPRGNRRWLFANHNGGPPHRFRRPLLAGFGGTPAQGRGCLDAEEALADHPPCGGSAGHDHDAPRYQQRHPGQRPRLRRPSRPLYSLGDTRHELVVPGQHETLLVETGAGLIQQAILVRRLQRDLQTSLLAGGEPSTPCPDNQVLAALSRRLHDAPSMISCKAGSHSILLRRACFASRRRLRTVSTGTPALLAISAVVNPSTKCRANVSA